jgi:hypothetical protein
VIVDLILEAGGSGLIETVELVEIDGVSIGHQQAMEGDGEAFLAETTHLLRLTQNERAFRDEKMLSVLAVDRIRDHHLQRPGKLPVQTIDQNRVNGRALEDDIRLAVRGVDVHLRRTLVGRRSGSSRGLCGRSRRQARRVSRSAVTEVG